MPDYSPRQLRLKKQKVFVLVPPTEIPDSLYQDPPVLKADPLELNTADLLTQGNGACAFIGLIAPMIQEIVQKFGKEQMKPGDVYLQAQTARKTEER